MFSTIQDGDGDRLGLMGRRGGRLSGKQQDMFGKRHKVGRDRIYVQGDRAIGRHNLN